MKLFGKIIVAILSGVFFYSCEKKEEEKKRELANLLAEVREEFAPDGRVALFDIQTRNEGNTILLLGESDDSVAVSFLKKKLQKAKLKFTDSIRILPDAENLEGKTNGVVKISAANLRDEPKHAAQLVTQVTLGMPVKVLKKEGSWYYIQAPDGYLAWVDYGGIAPMTDREFSNWKKASKLIFLETAGNSYEKPNKESQRVSDLVAGNILEFVGKQQGFYQVQYPSGKIAFVEEASAQPFQEWLAFLEADEESLVETGKSLMGAPYLWGGTSPKGMDCSGFTKMVFFMNGMVLPRDASQQVHTGMEVDTERNFENLEKGDLLFFGRPATDSTSERIIHVGMWIGDNKFIHSMGEVHISNFDKQAEDFDQYNYDRYLRSKRVLDTPVKDIIFLKQADLFTDVVPQEVEL